LFLGPRKRQDHISPFSRQKVKERKTNRQLKAAKKSDKKGKRKKGFSSSRKSHKSQL